MLDISIPKLVNVVKTDKAAYEFCQQDIRVVEKLDGTKLTFIRNDTDFDEDDYLKNWIIAYKEGIVFPEEFAGLKPDRRSEIETQSAGRSQYSFVHEHLKRVHPNTRNFPKDYEFFIEFIQRKPTISRSYTNTGGLYLTGFGPTTYAVQGARVTSLADFENDAEMFEVFREALELQAYPLLFEGSWDSTESILDGSNSNVRHLLEPSIHDIDSFISNEKWLSALKIIINVFSDFTSALGGDAEGVVIAVAPGDSVFSGKLYKTSRADQHDQEARQKKKQEEFGEGDKESEKIYYDNLTSFIRNKIDEDDLDDENFTSLISNLSNLIYSMSRDDFSQLGVQNEKKALIVIQDDAISAVRNIVGKLTSAGVKRRDQKVTIGVIPMAAKPVHNGHWQLIKTAAETNDKVFLIVSAKSRSSGGMDISGSDMIKVWKNFLSGLLPSNVAISYSGEPVGDTRGVIRSYANDSNVFFTLYAGEDDADRFSKETFDKFFPIQSEAGRIKGVLIPNVKLSSGQRISGTYMRELLTVGKSDEFKSLLPEDLSKDQRDAIWKIFYKDKGISESILRYFIRETTKI